MNSLKTYLQNVQKKKDMIPLGNFQTIKDDLSTLLQIVRLQNEALETYANFYQPILATGATKTTPDVGMTARQAIQQVATLVSGVKE